MLVLQQEGGEAGEGDGIIDGEQADGEHKKPPRRRRFYRGYRPRPNGGYQDGEAGSGEYEAPHDGEGDAEAPLGEYLCRLSPVCGFLDFV